jgi:hypothetical protein
METLDALRLEKHRLSRTLLALLLTLGAAACDSKAAEKWLANGQQSSAFTPLKPLECDDSPSDRVEYEVTDPPAGVLVSTHDDELHVRVLGEGSEVRAFVGNAAEHRFAEPTTEEPAIIDLLPGVEVVISKSKTQGAYTLVATCKTN